MRADGRPVPVQARVLQRWQPEGSVRWLSLDFEADATQSVYELTTDGGPETLHPDPIEVSSAPHEVVVSTGSLRVAIPRRGSGGPFGKVWHRGRLLCDNMADATSASYLVDQDGIEYQAVWGGSEDDVSVEREGPLHSVVRIRGNYRSEAGRTTCAFTNRLHFYAGRPFVRLQHTFLFTENSDDLQLCDLGIRTALRVPAEPQQATFPLGSEDGDDVHTIDLRDGRASASLRQEVYHHLGQPESRWVLRSGGDVGSTRELFSGQRAGNWATLRAGELAMTVVMQNFWQEFPKELEVRAGEVVAHLWSGSGGTMLDFRLPAFREFWGGDRLNDLWKRRASEYAIGKILDGTYPSNAKGLAKTHDLLYYFHDRDTDPRAMARLFDDPPLAYADPAYTASTDTVGLQSPRDPARFPDEEAAIDTHLETAERLVREWGNYGWWEHGAGPHMTYEPNAVGEPVAAPWRYTGGVEYWFTRALWLAYLRSGDRRWFELAATRAKHFMDVVICHTDSDTRWRGSFFWTASGPPVHWGGSNRGPGVRKPEGEAPPSPRGYHLHQFGWTVDALLYYYYLTGDDRAWEVVEEYADFQKRRLDYKGWVDDALAPATTNIMKSRMIFATLDELSILYEATGDETFRRLSGELASRILLPNEPGGIHREPWPPGADARHPRPYALYYKTPCVIRYWRATGDPLARDTVVRMATYDLRAEHWGPFAAGVRGTYAWLFGAPEVYLGCGKHATWRNWQSSAMAAVDTPYDMALSGFTLNAASHILSLNALMAAERKLGRPLPPFPVLSRGLASPACELLVRPNSAEAQLGIRTGPHALVVSPPIPGVTTEKYFPEGLPPGQYRNDCAYHDVVFPAGSVGKIFRIEAPSRSEVHALVADGVNVVLHARDGFPIEAERLSDRWFFLVPDDRSSFVVECADPQLISVVSPTGRVTTPGTSGSLAFQVEVQQDERSGSWALCAADSTFVRVTGIRPVFAYRDAARLFDASDLVDVAAVPDEQRRRDRFVPGASGSGLELTRSEYLSVPLGEARTPQTRQLLSMLEGTVEFWFCTDWPYFFLPETAPRVLCAIPGAASSRSVLGVTYLKDIRQRGTVYDFRATLNGRDARIGNTARRAAWWMPGEWGHFAIEWGREPNGVFALRLYYNGEPGGNKGQEAAWAQVGDFDPLPIGDVLCILGGRVGSSFGGTIDELRISRTRRYRGESFKPTRRLANDEDALLHYRFEGELKPESRPSGTGDIAAVVNVRIPPTR